MAAEPERCGQIVVVWMFGGVLGWVLWRIAVAWGHQRTLRHAGTSVSPHSAIALTHDTINHTRIVIIASLLLAFVLALGEHDLYALLAAYVAVARVFRQIIAYGFLEYVAALDRLPTLHGNLLAVDDRYIVVPRHLARSMRSPSAISQG